ncbi:MAG TPA: hypothetical protein VFN35_03455 [Ktedonobacteraceae bacterium]|nr:hypothetical protein [Ktedonobacteraceae bacterium]
MTTDNPKWGAIPHPRGERGTARPRGSDWSSIHEAGIKEATVSLTTVNF